MPLGRTLVSQVAGRVELPLLDRALPVCFLVVRLAKADKVRRVVVERVEVGVVDVMTVGDWAVSFDPDFLVESTDAALAVGLPGCPVAAVGPPW
jgi:hypothetical protein